jgi:hypothetical protein
MTCARPKEQRAAANSRYVRRRTSAGIVKITVMVPADRIPELRGITLGWRRRAKMLLLSDQPSSDQILQTHAVCRELGIQLTIEAFTMRATAESWLLAHQPALGARRPHLPANSARA